MVTGEGRAEFDIPELGTSGPEVPALSEQGLRMAGAYAASADPEQIADIALKTLPGSARKEDKYGNVIIRFNDRDYYVNKPGVSQADLFSLLAQTGAFAPAAKFGAAGKTLLGQMARTGLASAGTSAGLDYSAEQLGSEQGISGGRAAVTGAAGVLFQGLTPLAIKGWRKIFGAPIAFDPKTGKLTATGAAQARRAGLDPEDMTERLSRIFAEEASEAVSPESAASGTLSREFDIPYTQGQRTQSFEQLSKEEATRKGAFGESSGDIMRQFDKEQQEAISAARQRVQEQVGETGVERPSQGVGIAVEGLQTRAARQAADVDRAYEAARGAKATFTGDSLSDLLGNIKQSITDFDIDPTLHPGTVRSIKSLAKLSREVKKTKKHGLDPVTLRRFETERRKLGNQINSAGNKSDRAALTRMKGELDRWLDDAVDNALFSGDDDALKLLKTARGARRQYGTLFEAAKGKFPDQPGKIIEKMVETDPTPDQAMNYLFGTAKLGKRQASEAVLKRLKIAVGEESAEWDAVREAAWLKLSQDAQGNTLSPRKFNTAYNEAMRNANGLMRTLYSKDELALMRRYRDALNRTVTPEGATNPSKTAYTLARLIRQLLGRTGTMFTFSGQPGLGAAFFTAARTPTAMGARTAKKALRPVKRLPKAPGPVAAGTAYERQE
ncbi:MAG: hypothetical protein ACR2RF_24790 [Geminicoccaceae bacterium]